MTVLYGLSCISSSDCWAVGGNGTTNWVAAYTTDGGTTWSTSKVCGSSTCNVFDISCVSTSTCWAGGVYKDAKQQLYAAVYETTDGGSSWSLQHQFPANTLGDLRSISCSSTTECTAVGDTSSIVSTADGGKTWTTAADPVPGNLTAVSCTTAGTCWATVNGTVIYRPGPTASWSSQFVSSGSLFSAISCTSVGECWTVGHSTSVQTTQAVIYARTQT